MGADLINKLIQDPGRWPYYLILAIIVIVTIRLINLFSDFIFKKFSEKLSERGGILSISKAAMQIFAIALIIYLANAFYWSKKIEQILPRPYEKPIITCEATVEFDVKSKDRGSTRFIIDGGYLVFAKGNKAILLTDSPDSTGYSESPNEYTYRALTKMDSSSTIIGSPVNKLQETEYIQAGFYSAPKKYHLISGKAVCVINNEIRFTINFPAQDVKNGMAFSKDLKSMMLKLNKSATISKIKHTP